MSLKCIIIIIIIITFFRDEAQRRRQDLGGESRDEILVQIGELEAQKRVLVALQSGAPSDDLVREFNRLKETLSRSNTALTSFADKTERYRQRCLISRIRAKANESVDPNDCNMYAKSAGNASDTVDSNTELFACVQDLDFQVNSFEESRDALNQTAQLLEEQIQDLKRRLASTDVKFSHLARKAQHAADSQEQLDSQWLQFSFDSQRYQSSSETEYSRTTSHFAASAGGGWGMFSFGASYSQSRSRSDYSFESAMNSAQTEVSGELLRITVQRPWFRPSIFKSPHFQIRVCEGTHMSHIRQYHNHKFYYHF